MDEEQERLDRLARMRAHAEEDTAAAQAVSVEDAPAGEATAPAPTSAGAAPEEPEDLEQPPRTTGASKTPRRYNGQRDPNRRVPAHILAAAARAERAIAVRDGAIPPTEDDITPDEHDPDGSPPGGGGSGGGTGGSAGGEPPRRIGAPTAYRPEYAEIAAAMCENGATDWDLAIYFGVSRTTIGQWKLAHTAFRDSLKHGKDSRNQNVVRSFYERCVGYSYESEKFFAHKGEVTRVQTVEHVPPDVGAIKSFLALQMPEQYGKLAEEGRGDPNKDVAQMTNLELARALAYVLGQGLIEGGALTAEAADVSPAD